jgi:hypothetical protein
MKDFFKLLAYGEPKPTDWCYANRGLVFTEWFPDIV